MQNRRKRSIFADPISNDKRRDYTLVVQQPALWKVDSEKATQAEQSQKTTTPSQDVTSVITPYNEEEHPDNTDANFTPTPMSFFSSIFGSKQKQQKPAAQTQITNKQRSLNTSPTSIDSNEVSAAIFESHHVRVSPPTPSLASSVSSFNASSSPQSISPQNYSPPMFSVPTNTASFYFSRDQGRMETSITRATSLPPPVEADAVLSTSSRELQQCPLSFLPKRPTKVVQDALLASLLFDNHEMTNELKKAVESAAEQLNSNEDHPEMLDQFRLENEVNWPSFICPSENAQSMEDRLIKGRCKFITPNIDVECSALMVNLLFVCLFICCCCCCKLFVNF
jgi:hypothetical protein